MDKLKSEQILHIDDEKQRILLSEEVDVVANQPGLHRKTVEFDHGEITLERHFQTEEHRSQGVPGYLGCYFLLTPKSMDALVAAWQLYSSRHVPKEEE